MTTEATKPATVDTYYLAPNSERESARYAYIARDPESNWMFKLEYQTGGFYRGSYSECDAAARANGYRFIYSK